MCTALGVDDHIATTHRGHGHCLAKGADVDGMMAELFAKETGLCRGKGGSMHVADPARGVLGANAIVGASIPLAVGAGLSSKLLGQGRVVVAFFGEGAANQGAFHEAVNLAAIWGLPVLLVLREQRLLRVQRQPDDVTGALRRGPCAGVWHRRCASRRQRRHRGARRGAGCGRTLPQRRRTDPARGRDLRWQGHYEGDAQPYKPAEESAAWRERDPLALARRRLLADRAATELELDGAVLAAEARVEDAIQLARAAPVPRLEEAYAHVFSD